MGGRRRWSSTEGVVSEKAITVASPCIQDVLDSFLEEQYHRVSARTYARYSQVVETLLACLNLRGHESLAEREHERFRRIRRDGDGREFCDVFGSKHILPNLDAFLGEFMAQRVLGAGIKRAAGPITRALVTWLVEKEYVSAKQAKGAAKMCDSASRDLPKAEELALRMTLFAQEQDDEVEERVEDLFTLTSVQTSWVWIRGSMDGRALGPIDLPEDICARCRVDWMIAGAVGRAGRKWRFIDAWNVYPSRG